MSALQYFCLIFPAIIMAISKAINNALLFYPTGKLSKYYGKWFAPPSVTYKNKDNHTGFALWLFQNPLVFLTDGWHFFDFLQFMAYPITASLYFMNWQIIVIFYLVFTILFTETFKYFKT